MIRVTVYERVAYRLFAKVVDRHYCCTAAVQLLRLRYEYHIARITLTLTPMVEQPMCRARSPLRLVYSLSLIHI